MHFLEAEKTEETLTQVKRIKKRKSEQSTTTETKRITGEDRRGEGAVVFLLLVSFQKELRGRVTDVGGFFFFMSADFFFFF